MKRHELATQRTELAAAMQVQAATSFEVVMRAADISTQLNQNAAADHEMLHRFSWAVYFGVSRGLHVAMLPQCMQH